MIVAVWKANYEVYGTRKLWHALRRAGEDVGRDQVGRLMRELGICGVRRGRPSRTTIADAGASRAPDLVNRHFSAAGPNRLWVTDLTYVPTQAGTAYVCFVVDVFSRMIVGWRVATNMATAMVLDALDMAHARRRGGLAGLVCHSDAGSQFTSIRFGERLTEFEAVPSIGSVGDSYDNAMAETVNGLYKTELIGRGTPWSNADAVELATLQWVHWFNTERLHSALGYVSPREFEQAHYRHRADDLVGIQ